jgi:hypothetical protein
VSYDSVLTISSAVGEAVVLVFLLHKRIWRILPVFSAYVLWALLSDLAIVYFRSSGSTAAYLRFYMIEMTVDSLLQFPVLVELAWSVLRPIRSSLPRHSLLVLIVLVAIAGLVIWPFSNMNAGEYTGQGVTIFHLYQTFAILRIVCFLVMACFSQLLSIGWRDRELQVATGLGLYSIASLTVTMLHSHQYSEKKFHYLDYGVSLSYLSTLVYWVVSFAAKEYQRKEFSPQMRDFLLLMGGGARKP